VLLYLKNPFQSVCFFTRAILYASIRMKLLSFDPSNHKSNLEQIIPREEPSKITNQFLSSSNDELSSDTKDIKHNPIQIEFIKSAAYELRSLTHAILGYSQLLQMDLEKADKTKSKSKNNYPDANQITSKKTLQEIVRSADELQKLINKVIDAAEDACGG
jgi:signal transduction histidine kinase